MVSMKIGSWKRGLPGRFFLQSLIAAVLIGALIVPAVGAVE